MAKCYFVGCPGQPDIEIYRIQKALVQQGFLSAVVVDPCDGVYGPRTRDAVMAFQKEHGLKVDGICGPLTQAVLIPGDAIIENNIRQKAPISTVAELTVQEALKYIGLTETGPNRHTLIDKWNRDLGLPPGSPWCMSFMQHCALVASEKAGVPDQLKPNTGHCMTLWRRTDPSRRVAPTDGRRGDIFIRKPNADDGSHTGIVLRYDAGWYITVEGNTSAAGSREGTVCRENRRKYSELVGFVRLP